MTGRKPVPRTSRMPLPALRQCAVLAISILAVLTSLVGCGGDSSDDVTTSLDRRTIRESLLSRGTLPSNSRQTKPIDVNSPCGPGPILRSGNALIERSPTFEVDGAVVQQIVGQFSDESRAIKAFDSLNAPERSECILSRISFGGFAEALRPRHLRLDDEAQLMRFRVRAAKAAPPDYLDAASIRNGRAVTALIFLSPGGVPDRQFEQRLLREAAARLDEL